MAGLRILLVAGTHGNEINAPWLMDQWDKKPDLIKTNDIKFARVLGNPAAFKAVKRYIDCDLNRSFCRDLLDDHLLETYEVSRARELLSLYGPKGSNPCQIVLDLHSTTSSMGSSLVVYGRRPSDLALASLIQARLGLPVYLHEGDKSQHGFLVESWPCGLVIEIGPVAQGLVQGRIVRQNQLLLEGYFAEIASLKAGIFNYPESLVVHRHLGSIDFPRDEKGHINAFVHPQLQGKDWHPIQKGSPLFIDLNGNEVQYDQDDSPVPVFINEAAYAEKQIAMSLTEREIWPVRDSWKLALKSLIH